MNLNTKPLSGDELISIHEASMELLDKVGVHIEGEEIFEIFKKSVGIEWKQNHIG